MKRSKVSWTSSTRSDLIGASGFIHVAHPTFDLTDPNVDPNAAMKDTVDGALNAIKASANAGIKRFVYASSSWAASLPKPDVKFHHHRRYL